MGTVRKFFLPTFDAGDDVLAAARKRLTHAMCLLSAIITSFYAYGELALILKSGYEYYSLIPYLLTPPAFLLLTWLVSRGLFVKGAASILILLIYGFTLTMRFDTGFFVPGAVYFVAIPMVGGMLLGVRAGAALSVLMVATYIGMFIFKDTAGAPARLISDEEFALQATISFSVLGTISAASALYFMHLMNKVIFQLRDANAQLENYKENLEKLVETRTRTIHKQAKEIEAALELERETNAMQNQLVAVVSHEIRTPLSIIDGIARRIDRKLEKMTEADIRQRTGTIRQNVQRLTQLMERTLDSSRYAEGKVVLRPTEFDLAHLMTEIINRLKSTALTYQFDVTLDEDLPRFFGDPQMLDHVFTNVISNAVKYSADRPQIRISVIQSGGFVEIRVRDHGIGIPKQDLPRIASRFFRASTASHITGTGVGLYLARGITQDHGGTLLIDSEEGEWTEITIRLPVESPLRSDHSENEADAA